MEPIFGLYLVDTGWNRQAVLLKLKEVCQLTFPEIKNLLDSAEPVIVKIGSLYDYRLHRILKAFENLDCRFQVRLLDLGSYSSNSIEEEEYRVYSTLLRTLSRNDDDPTVIYDLTMNPSGSITDTDFSWLQEGNSNFITHDLIADFQSKVLLECRFEHRFDPDCQYRFLSDALCASSSVTLGKFHHHIPDIDVDGKSFGYYNLSRVGFNYSRTRAIVGFSNSAYGMVFCFEKEGSVWVYRDRLSLWKS